MAPDFVIVGAGFAGSVCARELAEVGHSVLLLEQRPHVGGNAYDCHDKHGIQIHPYGPHIFHTNSKRVFDYLSQFTEWRFYEHRVRAVVNGSSYPFPINRETINKLYGFDLDEAGAKDFLASVREPRDQILTSEDHLLDKVGSDLCDKFFREYTRKQWNLDLSELSASVVARVPVRTNDDDRYFGDSYQFMPADGYTLLFERILDHPKISVRLNANFFTLRGSLKSGHLIFTGPIDEFFRYRFGKLPYRSLNFEFEHISDKQQYQETGTTNFPNEFSFTRITEFKHLTGQTANGTTIVREYPRDEGYPYYPIPQPMNEAIYQQYRRLADNTDNVTFIGRMANYRYYNMDQVVAASLRAAARLR